MSHTATELVRLLYSFNPIICVTDGFGWSVPNAATPFPAKSLLISLATTATGIRYFRKIERTFANVI